MQAEQSNDLQAENDYYDEIMAQGRVTKIFDLFNKKFGLGERNYKEKVNYDCYREVTKAYENRCGTLLDRDFRFMEDVDSRTNDELKTYTLQEQYDYLVKAVTGSNVMQYGDLTIAQKPLAEFFTGKASRLYRWIKKGIKKLLPPKNRTPTKIKINNENYRLEWFRMQAEQSNDLEAENEYYEEILAQGRVTKIFEIFNKRFELGKIDYSAKVDYDCYRQVSQSYADRCGTLIDRDFKFMPNIANFCTKGIKPIKADRAFKAICQ
jgi:hypothetical protein